MDLKNVIAAFFSIVIVLTLVSLLPSETQAGYFIMPSIISLEGAILILIISILILFFVLIPKKSYSI